MKASISSAAALFALLPILAGAHPHHGHHHHHHHHHDADSSSSSSSIQQYRKSLNFGPSHVHAKYEVEPKEHRHHRHSKKTMTTKRSFATTTTPSHEHLDDRIDPAARDIAVQVLDDEVSKIVTTTTTTTASGQGTRTPIEGVAYYIRDDVSLISFQFVFFFGLPLSIFLHFGFCVRRPCFGGIVFVRPSCSSFYPSFALWLGFRLPKSFCRARAPPSQKVLSGPSLKGILFASRIAHIPLQFPHGNFFDPFNGVDGQTEEPCLLFFSPPFEIGSCAGPLLVLRAGSPNGLMETPSFLPGLVCLSPALAHLLAICAGNLYPSSNLGR